MNDGFSFPHGLALAPADIGADAFAFSLGESSQHGDEDLAVCFQGIDVFFFEDYCDAKLSQGTNVVQAIHRISGEAGDRFGQDNVDFLLLAHPDHLQEFRSFSSRGACDALVSKDPGHSPVAVGHDLVGVVVLLGFIAGELLLIVGGDTAV